MKKILLISSTILITLILSGLNIVNAIDFRMNSSETFYCPEDKQNVELYISWETSSKFVYDTFWSNIEQYISVNSKVWIWESEPNLVTWCDYSWGWTRLSTLSPWENESVIALWANCTFNKPKNINNRKVQFVYNIKHYDITEWYWLGLGDYSLLYFLNRREVNNNTPHSSYFTNVGFSNLKSHWNECMNVEIKYCWDWIKDTAYWEECDPMDPNWAWNCNSECKIVACNTLEVTPTTWDSPLTSDFTCIGTNNESYRIDIRDSRGEIINSIDNNLWNYTFQDEWTYYAECYVDNTITSRDCRTNIEVGSSWDEVSCNYLSSSVSSVNNWNLTTTLSCNWTNASSYMIEIINDSNNRTVETINSDSWTITLSDIWTYTASCYVDNTITSSSCSTTLSINDTWWWTTCDSISASPRSARNSLVSDITCSWTDVSSFRIDCWNWQSYTWIWNNNWVESFSHTCSYNSRWSYSPTCYVDWTITSPNCTTNVSVTSGWWWWGSASCTDIEVDTTNTNSDSLSTNIICRWNNDVNMFKIDCWNDDQTVITNFAQDYLWNTYSEFVCNYELDWVSQKAFFPKCYVSDSISLDPDDIDISSLACNSRVTLSDWWWGGWSRCWNWIVEWSEECDYWNLEDRWPSCDRSTCKLINPISTIPYEGSFQIFPNKEIIIWDDINPFIYMNEIPSIKNNSVFQYNLKLCIHKTWGSSLNWSDTQCSDYLRLEPWIIKSYWSTPDLISDTSWISWNYDDNSLTVTTNNDLWAFYKSEIKVRVSKPSVATTWGWTSFVTSTSNIADINKVADEARTNPNAWINKNFVWAWITSNLSSETKNINSSDANNDAENDSINNDVNNNVSSSNWVIYNNISTAESFNWMSNVFIIKNNDVIINTTIPWTWAKTYIIENWDLRISTNINYNENIAFVVKWWDIIIDSSVETINWVYISIPENWNWWNIRGNWITKDWTLVVNWSLYWDITNLVNSRTKVEEIDWYLNVWTIVSFGSSVFRQPAPLTWKFIWEYLDSQKIAE